MENKKREKMILAKYQLGFKTNPLRIIYFYLVIGFGWILLSDTVLYALITDPNVNAVVQSYKGSLYVILTAALLYLIIKKDYHRILDLTAKLALSNEELTEYSDELEKTQSMLANQVTALNKSLDTINIHKKFSQVLYDNTNTAIVMLSINGHILDYNQYFTDLFGYGAGEIVGDKWHQYLVDGAQDVVASFTQTIKNGQGINNFESQALTKAGNVLEVVWNNKLVRDPVSNELVIFCIGIDRTAEKQNERQIYELAFKDRLTKLDNQVVFERQVEQLIDNNVDFTLYYLDFDNFRNLNDIHGHYYGDCFLQDYARMLKGDFPQIKVFRLGGDEFMLLDENCEANHGSEILSRLFKSTNRAFKYEDFSYYPSISVGVVKYPDDGHDRQMIFKNIDLALYKAKNKGKNQAVKFHVEIQNEIEQKMRIENGIRTMLLGGDFISHYQPIYDFKTREIIGVESLLRWDRNILDCNPAQLIEVAEQTGQIIKIDRLVVANSLKFMAEHFGGRKLTMSINLSTRTIESPGMVEYLLRQLSIWHIDPSQVIFEITEHSLFANIAYSQYLIKKLKAIGFKIALDDFGTQYSSFNYLKNLEFDRLKIDKQYIDKIHESSSDSIIIELIISLCAKLQIETVAEGIECQSQYEMVEAMGCTYAQGYLLAKPLPGEELIELINNNAKKS